MLSLKVFDRSDAGEMMEAYRRAASSLLEALLHQSMAGNESDHASFRDGISAAAAQLTAPDAKPSDILLATAAASTAIHDYNRHVVAAVRARRAELEAVVGMLTQTMAEVGGGSERSLRRLREIERRLTRSEEMFDVRDLRQQMADCLAAVREEAALRKKESDRLVADLKTAVRERDLAAKAMVKPAVRTGQGHDSIEEKIAYAAKGRAKFFVAVLAIDHLHPVVARFGEAVAAQVAAFCAEQARATLADSAIEVFVWKAAACVAVLDGAAGANFLERLVLREAQQRRSMTLQVHGGRDVLLHVTYSKWLLLPGAGLTTAGLVERMNEFLIQPAPAPKAS